MNCKTIILMLTVILIFTQCLVVNGTVFQKSRDFQEELKTYIVEFKDQCLSEFRVQLKEKIKTIYNSLSEKSKNDFFNKNYEEYKNSLFLIHKTAQNEISKLLETNNEEMFLKEFKSVFNGIVLKDVSKKSIEKIKVLPFVRQIFENQKYTINREEVVSLINADDIWLKRDSGNNSITGENITVAILDTGIDYHHEELKDNYIGGIDLVNGDDDPIDDEGHGTICAGIISAVAPNVKIYAMKVLDENGESEDGSEVISAIERAVDPNGDGDFSDQFIDIISMSFGSEDPGNPDWPVCRAVDNAFNAGIVAVAAAGNNGNKGSETISAPGCSIKSICVGATTKNDEIAYFSSRGPVKWDTNEIVKPDVVAPGVNINSTYLNNGSNGHVQGTSFSAPFVSGAAAVFLQAHPEWEPADVKNAIKESSVDLGYDENIQGAGRIDVLNSYYYPNLPLAVLDIPDSFEQGFVDIKGTVKSGTGNPNDLFSYGLYYKTYSGWDKIYEGYKEVNNGILIENWNITSLGTGLNMIRLIVKTINQTSSDDIKTVNIMGTITIILETGTVIGSPSSIYENTSFVLNIYNSYYKPVNALVFLTAPFSIPQIRYGSHIVLKAPRVLNPFSSEKQGKIIIIKLIDLKKIKHNLNFLNCINCFV